MSIYLSGFGTSRRQSTHAVPPKGPWLGNKKFATPFRSSQRELNQFSSTARQISIPMIA